MALNNTNLDLYFHMVNHYQKIKNARPVIDCSTPKGYDTQCKPLRLPCRTPTPSPLSCNKRVCFNPCCPFVPDCTCAPKKFTEALCYPKSDSGRSCSAPTKRQLLGNLHSPERSCRPRSVDPAPNRRPPASCDKRNDLQNIKPVVKAIILNSQTTKKKASLTKMDTPKSPAKKEAPKSETSKSGLTKTETPKSTFPKAEISKATPAKSNETKAVVDNLKKSLNATLGSKEESEVSQKTVEDHEYVHFLLRITEDILINNLYSNSGMDKVFESHIQANKGRLDEKKMRQQVENLKRELNYPLTKLNALENGECSCDREAGIAAEGCTCCPANDALPGTNIAGTCDCANPRCPAQVAAAFISRTEPLKSEAGAGYGSEVELENNIYPHSSETAVKANPPVKSSVDHVAGSPVKNKDGTKWNDLDEKDPDSSDIHEHGGSQESVVKPGVEQQISGSSPNVDTYDQSAQQQYIDPANSKDSTEKDKITNEVGNYDQTRKNRVSIMKANPSAFNTQNGDNRINLKLSSVVKIVNKESDNDNVSQIVLYNSGMGEICQCTISLRKTALKIQLDDADTDEEYILIDGPVCMPRRILENKTIPVMIENVASTLFGSDFNFADTNKSAHEAPEGSKVNLFQRDEDAHLDDDNMDSVSVQITENKRVRTSVDDYDLTPQRDLIPDHQSRPSKSVEMERKRSFSGAAMERRKSSASPSLSSSPLPKKPSIKATVHISDLTAQEDLTSEAEGHKPESRRSESESRGRSSVSSSYSPKKPTSSKRISIDTSKDAPQDLTPKTDEPEPSKPEGESKKKHCSRGTCSHIGHRPPQDDSIPGTDRKTSASDSAQEHKPKPDSNIDKAEKPGGLSKNRPSIVDKDWIMMTSPGDVARQDSITDERDPELEKSHSGLTKISSTVSGSDRRSTTTSSSSSSDQTSSSSSSSGSSVAQKKRPVTMEPRVHIMPQGELIVETDEPSDSDVGSRKRSSGSSGAPVKSDLQKKSCNNATCDRKSSVNLAKYGENAPELHLVKEYKPESDSAVNKTLSGSTKRSSISPGPDRRSSVKSDALSQKSWRSSGDPCPTSKSDAVLKSYLGQIDYEHPSILHDSDFQYKYHFLLQDATTSMSANDFHPVLKEELLSHSSSSQDDDLLLSEAYRIPVVTLVKLQPAESVYIRRASIKETPVRISVESSSLTSRERVSVRQVEAAGLNIFNYETPEHKITELDSLADEQSNVTDSVHSDAYSAESLSDTHTPEVSSNVFDEYQMDVSDISVLNEQKGGLKVTYSVTEEAPDHQDILAKLDEIPESEITKKQQDTVHSITDKLKEFRTFNPNDSNRRFEYNNEGQFEIRRQSLGEQQPEDETKNVKKKTKCCGLQMPNSKAKRMSFARK